MSIRKIMTKSRLISGLPWFFLLLVNFHLLDFLVDLSSAEQKSSETSKDQKVTLNFVDVDLPVIIKFISEVTKMNFIYDDRVKGKITVIAPVSISVNDAYNLFTSLLDMKGFTIIATGVNAFKIIPSGEAKQRGTEISRDKQPVNESYIARLISLKHISSNDALKFIQPLISKDGYVSAFGPGNLLLVIDAGLNIEKILSIIDMIDEPSMREGPEIVFLKFSSADTVAKVLNEGMKKSLVGAPQSGAVEETKAVADQRLNAVVLFGDKGARESMKSLVSLVDIPSPEVLGRINVYFLENADATDLEKVLEGFVKGTKPQQATAPGTPPVTPFEAASGISITADKASNALIIVASPSDYQSLSQVIKQLDKRRRQVYVEAMIVEASIEKTKELGTKWRLSVTHNGQPISIGGFGTIDSTAVQNVVQGLQGASIGGLGNYLTVPVTTTDSSGNSSTTNLTVPGFAFLFNLKDFKDAINVLSTPQILTSDNKEAEILVGENVPFVTQSAQQTSVSTATTGTILNSITRQDVGIILRIKPQITEGDHVKLDIYEEISSVLSQSDALTISVGPTLTKRSTKTSIVVKDQQTVVIGGLMQETKEESLTTMPVLSDIPILGLLFKDKSVTKNKTNLLVFLTPHIIRDSERLAQMTGDKQREFGVEGHRFANDELLLKFRDGISEETAKDIIVKRNASVIEINNETRVYHIRLSGERDREEAIREFSSMPQIQYVEPNYIPRMQSGKQ